MHQTLQRTEQVRDTRARLRPVEATFLATAEHFSQRAKQARSAEDRSRFRDSAKFYRALAAVTPAIPEGCRLNASARPWLSAQAERYSARAEMCRAIADCLREEGPKLLLMRMAASYDQLANRAEN